LKLRQYLRARHIVLALTVLLLIALASTWRPALAPSPPGTRATYDPALVRRGANLAALGLCANCHTVNQNAPFAGGLGIATPFGTVYSTNITPDHATGIGAWSAPAFARAMTDGVARDGHHLYPAFPYDHYTRLAPADITALYAFFMTRPALHAPARANALVFPLGFRPLLAGWKLLFLDHAPVASVPGQGADWNRGAYLANALGHCTGCHSPRTALGAVDTRQFLGGGEAEGWYAPALNAASPSPIAWTRQEMMAYLQSGIAAQHAMAGGPMQAVTASLAQADPADVRALSAYIVTLMGKPAPAIEARALAAAAQPVVLPPAPAGTSAAALQLQLGSRVYQDACARCHASGRTAGSGGALQLPAAIAVYDPDPRSLIHIVRDGIAPGPAEPGRWMPGFKGILTDEQVTALAAYLRHSAARQSPWPGLAGQVAAANKEKP
jgi:mono/diheme cytochrome c family protein